MTPAAVDLTRREPKQLSLYYRACLWSIQPLEVGQANSLLISAAIVDVQSLNSPVSWCSWTTRRSAFRIVSARLPVLTKEQRK